MNRKSNWKVTGFQPQTAADRSRPQQQMAGLVCVAVYTIDFTIDFTSESGETAECYVR